MRRPILALLALTVSISALGYIRSRAAFNTYPIEKTDSVRRTHNAIEPPILNPQPPPSCVTPPAGIVGWWPGDGNANDIQGPTFENGTLLNGTTFATGKVGQAFSFDGVDDLVRADNATIINGGPQATYDAWVYPAAVPPVDNYVAILSVGDAT
ncbi:MAG: hypothetical protein ACXW3F_18375, partial [Pyrinomonadaceae bacterium]